MTEPTDADRKRAMECIWGTLPREQVEAVARALAGERRRVHELYRPIAQDAWSDTYSCDIARRMDDLRNAENTP